MMAGGDDKKRAGDDSDQSSGDLPRTDAFPWSLARSISVAMRRPVDIVRLENEARRLCWSPH